MEIRKGVDDLVYRPEPDYCDCDNKCPGCGKPKRPQLPPVCPQPYPITPVNPYPWWHPEYPFKITCATNTFSSVSDGMILY